jgi:hypothetical protein
LPPVYAKALDAAAANPVVGDTYAQELLRRIDYDWPSQMVPGGKLFNRDADGRCGDGVEFGRQPGFKVGTSNPQLNNTFQPNRSRFPARITEDGIDSSDAICGILPDIILYYR